VCWIELVLCERIEVFRSADTTPKWDFSVTLTRGRFMHVHPAGLKTHTVATKLGFAPVTAHAVPGTQEAPSNNEGALASWTSQTLKASSSLGQRPFPVLETVTRL
jgi:hypothetical protein